MARRRLRILLTNDDGILSPGLLALKAKLGEVGEVTVVAPDGQRSGSSHSVTLGSHLVASEVSHRGERVGVSLSGTPVDCVKYAICEHMPDPPDLVVAGINLGANAGVSAFYSGTVAAAMEGSFFGIPSVAISTDLNGGEAVDCLPLAEIAKGILLRLKDLARSGQRVVLNVNFPALPPKTFKGLRITRQGLASFRDRFERRDLPQGGEGLWLAGVPGDHGDSLDLDVNALRAGYISVTPLRQDLTHDELFEQFKAL